MATEGEKMTTVTLYLTEVLLYLYFCRWLKKKKATQLLFHEEMLSGAMMIDGRTCLMRTGTKWYNSLFESVCVKWIQSTKLPHPLRFESQKGENLCGMSLGPGRNWEIGKWWATFQLVRTNWNKQTTSKHTLYSSIFSWNFWKVTFHPKFLKFSVKWS